jgi:hypothetical protein
MKNQRERNNNKKRGKKETKNNSGFISKFKDGRE